MKPITQLDQNLINKIAAGEVVERPLSVIKELVENSIDAQASSITVEITGGGIDSMRITDNGSGIAKDCLPLAFCRHATSKISGFDDLMRVETMGFRGEALSSISSVAQVELITKTSYDSMGSRVVVHGGETIVSEEVGATDGTTVVVSNLFYNVPARRKFLKKPSVEAGQISHAVERLALGNPNLAVRYINDGNIVFMTNGSRELKTAMLRIYGRDVVSGLVEVSGTDRELALSGYVAKPVFARGNRQHESFFVNGRYIVSKLLTLAVESGIKSMFGAGKFPLFVLNLVIPFSQVDVNVHPNKMDVRFSDEEAVYGFVNKCVADGFRGVSLIPEVRLAPRVSLPRFRQGRISDSAGAGGGESSSESVQLVAGGNITLPANASLDAGRVIFPPSSEASPPSHGVQAYERRVYGKPSQTPIYVGVPDSSGYRRNDSQSILADAVILGQFFSTYWLVTKGESLYLIDQHAAHERILYESFTNELRSGEITVQNLLEPIKLDLGERERKVLEENLVLFGEFGFCVDGSEITTVPVIVKGTVALGFFMEILDKLGEPGFSRDSIYSHKKELVSVMACKAAAKAGEALGESDAREIIEKLLLLENPFTCPHGRPTIIEITKREIEKRFGRI